MVTHLRNITSRAWESGCENQDCPNGKLTPAKFVDMYKMFFPSGNAEEFCDHVFRTFDMDKNGYIDFKIRKVIVLGEEKAHHQLVLNVKFSNHGNNNDKTGASRAMRKHMIRKV
uniref:EF-hand domain-containing protein n=1 Tax=Anopheles melas TaxID=34690 RepID=A0A182UGR8_9DIPT